MVPRTPPCIESIPMAMYAQINACPSSSILRLSRTVLKHNQPSTDFQDFLPSFLRIFLYFFPLNPSTHHSHERNSTVNCSYVNMWTYRMYECTHVPRHITVQITGHQSTPRLAGGRCLLFSRSVMGVFQSYPLLSRHRDKVQKLH